MKPGDIMQSRSDPDDFILIERLSASGKTVRTNACQRNGRRLNLVCAKRASTLRRDYRRYFSTEVLAANSSGDKA
jgi:hypothetical protein